jgi:hypothetical protein
MSTAQYRRDRQSYSNRGGAAAAPPPAPHTTTLPGYWCDNQQSQCQDIYPTCGGGRNCNDCGNKKCNCNSQQGGQPLTGDYCDHQQTQCADNFTCATGGSDPPRRVGGWGGGGGGGDGGDGGDDETYRLYKQYKRIYKKAKQEAMLGATIRRRGSSR